MEDYLLINPWNQPEEAIPRGASLSEFGPDLASQPAPMDISEPFIPGQYPTYLDDPVPAQVDMDTEKIVAPIEAPIELPGDRSFQPPGNFIIEEPKEMDTHRPGLTTEHRVGGPNSGLNFNVVETKPGDARPVKKSRSASKSQKSRNMSPMKSAPRDVVIAVFGMTGTGKSTFISKVTGKDAGVGHNLRSFTSNVAEFTTKIDGRKVTLLDTPGFNDTSLSDTEVLQRIASWMRDAYEDKTTLTGVIYLHRITDVRMEGTQYKNLKLLRDLCGSRSLKNVMLISTRWEEAEHDKAERFEDELLREDNFWGDLKAHGAIVRRHDGEPATAMGLVKELTGLDQITLKIQEELAVEKKRLIDTAAGRTVSENIEMLRKKHEEDIQEVRDDMQVAIQTNDARWRKELTEHHTKLQEKLAKLEADKKALQAPIIRKNRILGYWRCNFCNTRLEKVADKHRHNPVSDCPRCGKRQKFVD